MAVATKSKSIKPKRQRRDFDQISEFLPGATEFSDDSDLTDSFSVMKLIKEHLSGAGGPVGDLWDRTSAKLDMSKPGGRPRLPGDWGLLYAAGYTLSRQSEMVSFWDQQLLEPLWQEAGFSGRRPYSSMWLRFGELEDDKCVDAFDAAADELIQLAMSKEPRIGRALYGDATSVHTRARLHHDCPDPKACREAGKSRQVLETASPDLVKDTRKEEAKSEPVKSLRHPDAQRTSKPSETDKYPHYVWVGTHRYGVLDPDVGTRLYRTAGNKVKKFWTGYLDMALVDGFTGGTVSNIVAPASKQEFNLYVPLAQKSIRSMGGVIPEIIGGDRGQSIERVFRFNAELGICSAFPFRKPNQNVERQDMRCEAFDEHGVARCPKCGGPGKQTAGWTIVASGSPRLRFSCASPNTVECMTISWSLNPADHKHGWRALVGLSRLSPRYMQARQAQGHFEKTWRERRKRYYIDGADETGKLKRFGLGAHRLRTAVARFLEWFRICLRHGWIMGYAGKRNTNTPKIRNANKRLLTIGFARRWQGLDLPYGPQAFALGLAATPDVPPARPSPTNARERDGTGDSDDSD